MSNYIDALFAGKRLVYKIQHYSIITINTHISKYVNWKVIQHRLLIRIVILYYRTILIKPMLYKCVHDKIMTTLV